MNPTRTLTALAIGLAAASIPATAYAHDPTPADYARMQEACAQYEDQGGCPGPVIEANLHPETLCTPTTVPACTNGPTSATPLASTGPVPPAPGPSPTWEEQIARNYPTPTPNAAPATSQTSSTSTIDPGTVQNPTASDPVPNTTDPITAAPLPTPTPGSPGAFLDTPAESSGIDPEVVAAWSGVFDAGRLASGVGR